jgi:hypothetical protein
VFRQLLASAVVMLTVLSTATGWAAQLPSTLKVGEQNLVLNGAGERHKYFLDLYVAGLYLTEPNSESKTIIDADAPMAIRIAITSKLVSQEKFLDSLQEGFQKSTGGKLEPIRAEIKKFRQCFAEEIARGNVFDLVYLPSHGLMVYKDGKQKGIVPGLAFKRALFGIWLSDRPADANLKQALLGGAANTRRR